MNSNFRTIARLLLTCLIAAGTFCWADEEDNNPDLQKNFVIIFAIN